MPFYPGDKDARDEMIRALIGTAPDVVKQLKPGFIEESGEKLISYIDTLEQQRRQLAVIVYRLGPEAEDEETRELIRSTMDQVEEDL